MSTYTDLHNRIKEGIVVNCGGKEDRVTLQKVKFLNSENEYRGSFTGTINVERSNMFGGTLSGVLIVDSVLLSGISWPGGQEIDKCRVALDALSNEVESFRDQRLPSIENSIANETKIRMEGDDILDGKILQNTSDLHTLSSVVIPAEFRVLSNNFANVIDNKIVDVSSSFSNLVEEVSVDITNQLTSNVKQLSDAIDSVSSIVDEKIDAVSTIVDEKYSELTATDSGLSSKLLGLSSELNTEIARSKQQETAIELSVAEERSKSIARDIELKNALIKHSEENDIQFGLLETKLTDNLEKYKHYSFNGSTETTKSYPFKVKDFAVNVIETRVKDGFLYDSGNVLVGSINRYYNDGGIDHVDVVFSNLSKSPLLNLVLTDPFSATLYPGIPISTPKSWYKIEYVPAESPDSSIEKLLITPYTYDYYNLIYGKTDQIIGKLENCKLERKEGETLSSLISCTLTMNVSTDDPDFGEFARDGFMQQYFNVNGPRVQTINTEEIELLPDGKSFKFSKGIQYKNYIPLSDDTDAPIQFGQILSGTVQYEDATLTRITPRIYKNELSGINADVYVDLTRANRFYNAITDKLFLSAITESDTTTFAVMSVENRYAYDFFEKTDVTFAKPCGIVVPDVINRTFDPSVNPNVLSVFISNLPEGVPSAWKKEYTLTKLGSTLIWEYSNKNNESTDWITVRYDKQINELLIEGYYTTGIPVYFRNVYKIKLIGQEADYPRLYPDGSTLNIIATTRPIVLSDPNEYSSRSKVASAVYDFIIFKGPYSPESGREIQVDVRSASTDTPLKVVIPSKSQLLTDMSREFLLVTKFYSSNKTVSMKFVDENDTDIVFWNNKKSIVNLPANQWTTLKVQELKAGKFLVVDLNDNDDHIIIDKLSAALSTEIITRTEQVVFLSSEIDDLSTKLSVEIDNLSTNLSTDISSLNSEFTVVSNDLYELSNDLSGISANFNERISENTLSIIDLYKQIQGQLDFKGILNLDATDKYGPTVIHNTISALFINNLIVDPTSQPIDSALSVNLRNGFYFVADATENPLSTFEFEGLKILKKDWIIIKENTEVSNITADKVAIFDAQDVDVFHLSTGNVVTTPDDKWNMFYGNTYVDKLSVNIENVNTVSVENISAKNGIIDNLTCDSTIDVEKITVNQMSAAQMSASNSEIESSNISNLTVISANANKLTTDNHIATSLSANSITADNLTSIVTEMLTANISSEVVLSSDINQLHVESLSASAINVVEMTAVDAKLSSMYANDLSVSSLSHLSVIDRPHYNYDTPTAGISAYDTVLDVLDLSVDNITTDVSAVSSFIWNEHYDKTLSTNIELGPDHAHDDKKYIVDLLLIRDEITFNLYKLTMRNGTLNVDIVNE